MRRQSNSNNNYGTIRQRGTDNKTHRHLASVMKNKDFP